MRARLKWGSLATLSLTLPLLGAGPQASTTAAGQQTATLMSAPVAQSPQRTAAIVAQLSGARDKYGIDPDHSFRLTVQHPGAGGTVITRLAHTYKGVRVFQSESVVVSDPDGNIVSESVSDRRNGLGRGPAAAALYLGGQFADFNVIPALQPQAAVDAIVRSMAAGALPDTVPQAELVIYPVVKRVRLPAAIHKREWQLNATDLAEQVTGYELAYLVKARLVRGDGEAPLVRDAIVSANDGRIIDQWDALQTTTATGKSQYNGEVPLSLLAAGRLTAMRDPLRGVGGTYGGNTVTNANHGSAAGYTYSTVGNTWGDGQNYIRGGSTTNPNGQTAAVNAMWGMMNTYDTLKNVLGWHSLDGNNTATSIAVHVYKNYDNAFYSDSCRCMFIGDGGSIFNNLGSIDIIGHEMGHGVTAATSDLSYFGESGGLNESASDINGEMVEAYARAGATGSTVPASGNDWMIGKEIGKSGDPLRWMYKPSKDKLSPDAWSSSLARLDVHYSSGPNNRMFYFLSQGSSANSTSDYYSPYLTRSPRAMTGIGNDKAYRIWFRALTTKFTASTNYVEARDKVIAAAQELYGPGSREAIAVARAYAAINVGDDIDESAAGGALSISAQPHNVAVDPGTTATFAVLAVGGKPPYRYQWLRNGANIPGATGASYSLSAQAGDNGARFAVRVSDSALPPVTVTSSTATLAVSASAANERVFNGSFEQADVGWTGTAGLVSAGTATGAVPYAGRYFAYLGGKGSVSREVLEQAVQIPATAASAKLSLALRIQTSESSRRTPFDKLTLSLKNPAGAVLGTLAVFSNTTPTSGYKVYNFDLSRYKGQSVTLSFVATEDFSFQTSFFLDEVSLITE